MKWYIVYLFFVVFSCNVFAQMVYKTPSGEKYHTETCRHVKNVSMALDISEAKLRGLTACTQCNPTQSGSHTQYTQHLGIKPDEAKGVSATVQCRGYTKSGKRCSRKTCNKNGYCFQHER